LRFDAAVRDTALGRRSLGCRRVPAGVAAQSAPRRCAAPRDARGARGGGAMTNRMRNVAALCAVVGAVLVVAGAFVDARRTAFAYLVAFAFVFAVSVGALGLLMIGYATHARWFVVVRRLCEAIVVTVPVLLVLFVPVALWTKKLYLWADDPSMWSPHVRDVIHARGPWHAPAFFFARSYFYLLVLSAFAVGLRRLSLRQ